MQLTTIAEIWWDFDAEDPNWRWCVAHASFAHREACEFVLHIGSESYWTLEVEHMRQGGCTEDFIAAYLAAKDAGVVRVIFYC
jgi:hypothetical protein